MSMTSHLMAAVLNLISGLEASSGMPIAILDRIEDTQRFWARSAAILCEKTGDNFCEQHMQFMTANTEPNGMSRIIEYRSGNLVKRVCAVLAPIDNVDPTGLGESFGTGFPSSENVPSSEDTQAWLTLYHAAHCLDTEGTDHEEKRAAAFATIGLAIIDADPAFTWGIRRSPPRQLAVISGQESAYWAAGVGERLLLDTWKEEAALRLRNEFGCNATVLQNTSIDIENIQRHQQLVPQESCGTVAADPVSPPSGNVGVVSDHNLWIWMYGSGGLGVPPLPWTPMKMFADRQAAAKFAIETSDSLAQQK